MSNNKSIMASSSPSSPTPSSPVPMTLDQGGGTVAPTLFTVHPDIIHILTRLDGPTLAAVACVSSQLHHLSAEENIWQEICSAIWPSVNHPSVRYVISTFPSGHRSLFSDSFPLLDHQPLKRQKAADFPTLAAELISAVGIYYQGNLIYSKVKEMETATGWFLYSPFRIDLLDQKESVPTPIQCTGQEEPWLKHLEDNLTLSWIVIDRTRKREGNMSSRRPVSAERHWLTRDVQVRYSAILWGRRELVECRVLVTCGGEEGGGMHVREVSMQMVIMEGKRLSGAESLGILQAAMEGGRRREMKGNEGKVKYEDFAERKRERKERKGKDEWALDLVCIAIGTVGLVAFWWTIFFRSYSKEKRKEIGRQKLFE